MSDPQNSIRDSFLTAMFSLLGYVASCDGPVNRAEIIRIKFYMDKMQMTEEESLRARQCLKYGAAPDFDLSQTLTAFKQNTTPKLIHILLVYLITLSRADGFLKKREMHVIQRIARELGFRSIVFNHLLKMISDQDELYIRAGLHLQQPPPGNAFNEPADQPQSAARSQSEELQAAYNILGVTGEMTEDEIRRAYKKLASQWHPDKLVNQELSQEAQTAAAEQFKQIQVAYAFIKKYRSIYSAR